MVVVPSLLRPCCYYTVYLIDEKRIIDNKNFINKKFKILDKENLK